MTSMKRLRETDSELNGEIRAKRTINTCTRPAPLSYDNSCEVERSKIDHSIRITKEMAENNTAHRPVRVYADGIYDMFHSGHARQLMQAKTCFPNVYLIVGVCNDDLTHNLKGCTVMNETERYEAVRHCRYVDEVVANVPWAPDDAFLEENQIDFWAHDDLPYRTGDAEDIYKCLEDRGMFVATQRMEGISTTDVIARIIKDYDMYIRGNLLRGYSAKELNVSYMREKRLILKEKVDAIKAMIASKKTQVIDKSSEMLDKWEEKSRDFISNFLELFGRDGRINQWFNEGRLKVARVISRPNVQFLDNDSSSSSSSSSPPAKQREGDGTATGDDSDYEY